MDTEARGRGREAFGAMLRAWRTARGLSQMRLAHLAGVSSRHMSFVETGRARPGRDLVLRLTTALDIPLRARNQLLESAGYARVYPDTGFDERALDRVRETLQFILDRHEPYGAVVVDHAWRLLMANAAHRRLSRLFLDEDATHSPSARPNLLELVFSPDGFRPWIVNFEEVGGLLGGRLRRQMEAGPPSPDLGALLGRLEAFGIPSESVAAAGSDLPLLIPIHLRRGTLDLRLVTAITTFGAPQDALVQELRVETFFPADEATERFIRQAVGGGV